jgi:aconitate decarboxylase
VGWDYVPSGMTGAQMNFAYAATVSLTDGECFRGQYTKDRLEDQELLDLTSKISVILVKRLDNLGREGRLAIVMEIYLTYGKVIRGGRIHAKGSSHHPLTNEEVLSKYQKLAESVMPGIKVHNLRELILKLEHCSDVRELTFLLKV